MSQVPNKKQLILDTVSDLVGRLMYYDRKEDNELPRGAIEQAVSIGDVTVDEIVAEFSTEIRKNFR